MSHQSTKDKKKTSNTIIRSKFSIGIDIDDIQNKHYKAKALQKSKKEAVYQSINQYSNKLDQILSNANVLASDILKEQHPFVDQIYNKDNFRCHQTPLIQNLHHPSKSKDKSFLIQTDSNLLYRFKSKQKWDPFLTPKHYKRRKSHDQQHVHNLKHSPLQNVHITLYKLIEQPKTRTNWNTNMNINMNDELKEDDDDKIEDRPESVGVNQVLNVESLDSSVMINLNCGLKSLLPTMKNTMVDFQRTQQMLNNNNDRIIYDSNKLIIKINFTKTNHPIISLYRDKLTKQSFSSQLIRGFKNVKFGVKLVKDNIGEDKKAVKEVKKSQIEIQNKLPEYDIHQDELTNLNKEYDNKILNQLFPNQVANYNSKLKYESFTTKTFVIDQQNHDSYDHNDANLLHQMTWLNKNNQNLLGMPIEFSPFVSKAKRSLRSLVITSHQIKKQEGQFDVDKQITKENLKLKFNEVKLKLKEANILQASKLIEIWPKYESQFDLLKNNFQVKFLKVMNNIDIKLKQFLIQVRKQVVEKPTVFQKYNVIIDKKFDNYLNKLIKDEIPDQEEGRIQDINHPDVFKRLNSKTIYEYNDLTKLTHADLAKSTQYQNRNHDSQVNETLKSKFDNFDQMNSTDCASTFYKLNKSNQGLKSVIESDQMDVTNYKSTFYKLNNINQGLNSVSIDKVSTDSDDKLISSLHKSRQKLIKLHDDEFRNQLFETPVKETKSYFDFNKDELPLIHVNINESSNYQTNRSQSLGKLSMLENKNVSRLSQLIGQHNSNEYIKKIGYKERRSRSVEGCDNQLVLPKINKFKKLFQLDNTINKKSPNLNKNVYQRKNKVY